MIDRDKNFPLIYSLITVRNSVTVSETVRAHVGCPKIWEGRSRGSAALKGVADPKQLRNTPSPRGLITMPTTVVLDQTVREHIYVYTEICLENLPLLSPLSRSLKVNGTNTDRSAT